MLQFSESGTRCWQIARVHLRCWAAEEPTVDGLKSCDVYGWRLNRELATEDFVVSSESVGVNQPLPASITAGKVWGSSSKNPVGLFVSISMHFFFSGWRCTDYRVLRCHSYKVEKLTTDKRLLFMKVNVFSGTTGSEGEWPHPVRHTNTVCPSNHEDGHMNFSSERRGAHIYTPAARCSAKTFKWIVFWPLQCRLIFPKLTCRSCSN